MSTVEGKKQEKRRALLDAAYELFLERGTAKTSVEDITSRAKVGKGTFYLYFQDKGAVMQALLGRVSYQLLSDACLAVEQHPELPDFTAQVVFVIDHIIEALRQDALVLRFLERNFVWPGLDQIEASREAEPLMRKLLAIVLSSPEMAGRSEREVYQRITALGSMCMSVCYSSILEGKPDNIDAMKPVLYDIIRRAELYHGDIAIAALDQECDRVIAAKAADEMLTLQGVRASFVLYRKDDGIYISARSLGEINVQVLVETLGGGGNSTTAGGQCSGMTVAEAKTTLLRAIDKYFEE